MAKPQAASIRKLRKQLDGDPIERILLAKEYGIKDWLLGAYDQLISRKEPLTLEEASALGSDCTLKIMHAREQEYEEILKRFCDERATTIHTEGNRRGDRIPEHFAPRGSFNSWSLNTHPIMTSSRTDRIKQVFGI